MKTLLNAAICSVLLGALPVGADVASSSLVLKASPDLDGTGPGISQPDIQFVSGGISGDLDLSLLNIFDLAPEIIANAGGSAELDELINAGFDQQELENVSVGLGMVMDAIGAKFVNTVSNGSSPYQSFEDIVVNQIAEEDENTISYEYHVNQNVEVCAGSITSCLVAAEVDLSITLKKEINVVEEASSELSQGTSWALTSPMVTLKIDKISMSNDSARLEFTNIFGGAPAQVTYTPSTATSGSGEGASSAAGPAPVELVAGSTSSVIEPIPAQASSSSVSSFSDVDLWNGEYIVLSDFEFNLEFDSEGYLAGGSINTELTNMQLGAHAVTKSSDGEIEMFATMISGDAQRFSYDYQNEQSGMDEVQFRGAQLIVEMAFLQDGKNIDFAEASIWGEGYGAVAPDAGNPSSPVTSDSSISVSSSSMAVSYQASMSSASSSLPSTNPAAGSSSLGQSEGTTRRAGSLSVGNFLIFLPFMLIAFVRRKKFA